MRFFFGCIIGQVEWLKESLLGLDSTGNKVPTQTLYKSKKNKKEGDSIDSEDDEEEEMDQIEDSDEEDEDDDE